MTGRPMSEAPRDGTVVLAETMNYYGVPATGGYRFARFKFNAPRSSWIPAEQAFDSVGGSFYGEGSFLRWFPGDTDPKTLALTERTNWNFIPSNGTEGDGFYNNWCERCIRERAVREDHDDAIANGKGCDIFSRSLAFKIDDPEYPTEWTYKPDGIPKCTAFELDVGEPKQEPRCQHTKDMFAAPIGSSLTATSKEQP